MRSVNDVRFSRCAAQQRARREPAIQGPRTVISTARWHTAGRIATSRGRRGRSSPVVGAHLRVDHLRIAYHVGLVANRLNTQQDEHPPLLHHVAQHLVDLDNGAFGDAVGLYHVAQLRGEHGVRLVGTIAQRQLIARRRGGLGSRIGLRLDFSDVEDLADEREVLERAVGIGIHRPEQLAGRQAVSTHLVQLPYDRAQRLGAQHAVR